MNKASLKYSWRKGNIVVIFFLQWTFLLAALLECKSSINQKKRVISFKLNIIYIFIFMCFRGQETIKILFDFFTLSLNSSKLGESKIVG